MGLFVVAFYTYSPKNTRVTKIQVGSICSFIERWVSTDRIEQWFVDYENETRRVDDKTKELSELNDKIVEAYLN